MNYARKVYRFGIVWAKLKCLIQVLESFGSFAEHRGILGCESIHIRILRVYFQIVGRQLERLLQRAPGQIALKRIEVIGPSQIAKGLDRMASHSDSLLERRNGFWKAPQSQIA